MLIEDEVSSTVAQKMWLLTVGGGYIHLIDGSLIEGLADSFSPMNAIHLLMQRASNLGA